MNKIEVSQRYQIPIKILNEYESWGLCDAVKIVMGQWQYDDTDLERLSTIMTLHNIGFENKEIEHYMRLLLEVNDSQQTRIDFLTQKRKAKLALIHQQEKQLEKIDYMCHEIKNKSKEVL